jgi:DNA mismatch endonuclease, patch repair protein
MRGNRRADTRPEIAVRSCLHRAGLRFRKDLPLVVGETRVRPDIVFTRARVAVFIDGCFWHCCPDHGNKPKANVEYWTSKLRRNRERDARVNRALAGAGWKVIRIWEHVAPVDAAKRVVREVAHSA